jgi:hypothetical protein
MACHVRPKAFYVACREAKLYGARHVLAVYRSLRGLPRETEGLLLGLPRETQAFTWGSEHE